MTPAAERQRRCRARRRCGLLRVCVDLDAVLLADELVVTGWLAPHLADDDAAIRAAFRASTIRILPVTRATDPDPAVLHGVNETT